MKNFTLLLAALFAVFLTSCQKESLNELSTNNDIIIESYDSPQKDMTGKISLKETMTLYFQEEDKFSLFYEALVHSNLIPVLSNNNITVFAPTNLAMKKFLAKGQYETVQEIQPALLKDIMSAHISVTGLHLISSNVREKEVEVLYENQSVNMVTTDASLHFGNIVSYIEIANQYQANGIVHQINEVLIP